MTFYGTFLVIKITTNNPKVSTEINTQREKSPRSQPKQSSTNTCSTSKKISTEF